MFSITSGPATITGNTLTITGAGTVVVKATQAGDGNYNTASAGQSFIVELIDGLEDADNLVTISPNPTTRVLTINGAFKHASVVNTLGHEVLKTTDSSIEVDHLPRGMYIVRLTGTDQSVYTKKLILR